MDVSFGVFGGEGELQASFYSAILLLSQLLLIISFYRENKDLDGCSDFPRSLW